MDLIESLSKLAVQAYGAAIALSGLLVFSEGKSQNNAGAQSEGMSKMLGGAVIFMAGTLVVPAIFNMLSI